MIERLFINVMSQPVPSPQFEGLWRFPGETSASGYRSLSYWTDIAVQLEKAGVDALFLADIHGIYDIYDGSRDAAVARGVQVPAIDPVLLASSLIAVTKTLGFAVTYSTTYNPPYQCARVFSTLDHLSGGRIGWNLVTSYLASAERNGMGTFEPHDLRYDKADEYVKIVRALWEESWQSDAIQHDVDHDLFTDPEKVHTIDHSGPWYSVEGPHVCEPSPQRTPVIYQAGASRRGTRFAAQHAEAIFATFPSVAVGVRHMQALRQAVEDAGRPTERVKPFQSAFTLIAPSPREARQKAAAVTRMISREGELTKLCAWIGVDLKGMPDDLAINNLSIEASQSIRAFLKRHDSERDWTIGDLRSIAIMSRSPHRRTGWLVGTPERVADQMEDFAMRTGIDGFNLIPCPPRGGIDDICNLLMPELQRRGLVPDTSPPEGLTLRQRYFGAQATGYL
ncbi:MAG: NtaA/DmoA family FMN-dependent monooxygenase [Paracoccaceae bacterium]|nr:NtaA/DmoA family FMN-dependent monooxygenase [Paracoccaceae bacterium]